MEFEKRGVLSVTVCTSDFFSLLKRTGEAKGFPHLAIVTVSHPIGGIDLTEVRKKAEGAIKDILEILIHLPGKLPEGSTN
jgi:hypothetical protein